MNANATKKITAANAPAAKARAENAPGANARAANARAENARAENAPGAKARAANAPAAQSDPFALAIAGLSGFTSNKEKRDLLEAYPIVGKYPYMPDGKGNKELMHVIKNKPHTTTAKDIFRIINKCGVRNQIILDRLEATGYPKTEVISDFKKDIQDERTTFSSRDEFTKLNTILETTDSRGLTPLWVAASMTNENLVEVLVHLGANIEHEGEYGITPLAAVAFAGSYEAPAAVSVVNLLLDRGANINKRMGIHQCTALYVASELGHSEVVDVLLQRGAMVDDATNEGATSLFIASHEGHLGIVETLLEWGAVVDAAMHDGVTPLNIASEKGHLKVVKALLAGGAAVDAAANDGSTPLFIASEYGHLEVVTTLLAGGAAGGAAVDAAANDGATPLNIASEKGHLGVVKALLAGGAAVNAARNTGSTPLHIASWNNHLEVVNALLAGGAGLNIAMQEGWTPLHVASHQNHLGVVNALLAGGAELNNVLNDGRTPLFIASEKGHLEVVEALLAGGAEVDAAMNGGITPLLLASFKCRDGVVHALLERGANVRAKEHNGATPLHVVCNANDESEESKERIVSTVELLLGKDTGVEPALIEIQDNAGLTPLEHACAIGNLTAIKHLFKKGNIPAGIRDRCITSARNAHHTEIVEFLRRNKCEEAGVCAVQGGTRRRRRVVRHSKKSKLRKFVKKSSGKIDFVSSR
jgi:ankyrin repeat protein